MTLTAVRRTDVDTDTWDTAVRSARQRHFMFETAYISYHSDRFHDTSLLILDKHETLAAFPASRHGDEVVSHGGLTFGGMLASDKLGAGRVTEALDAALDLWRSEGARRLVVKPVPHIYHTAPAEEELFALHARGAQLASRHVSQARRSGTQVRWSGERRRAVKRGRDSDLSTGRSEAVADFIDLLSENLLRRHGVAPVHTADELQLLAARFPEAIKLFEARARDELLAGVLIYETPMVAHAQYITASEHGHELRAQDALFAYLLEEVYASKPWFDFGISNERDGSLNQGLARNKEGFGARSVTYDSYTLDL